MLNKIKGWFVNLLYRFSPLHAILTEAVRVRDNRIEELHRTIVDQGRTVASLRLARSGEARDWESECADLRGQLEECGKKLGEARADLQDAAARSLNLAAQLASAEDHAGALERKVAKLMKEREKQKGKRGGR